LVFFGLVLMLTLRFARNGLLPPLINYFTRAHVAAETVAKLTGSQSDNGAPRTSEGHS